MLVFFKHKYGSTIIDGKRIYGYLERYDPAKISWQSYLANKDRVVQAAYDKRLLEKMFPGKEFPGISFTFNDIKLLTWEQMCSLCQAFGFTTPRSNKERRVRLRLFMRDHC